MSKKGAPGKIMELVLAVVTLINLVLAMVIKVNERKTVIKAVSDDENVKALIVDKKISQEISKLG